MCVCSMIVDSSSKTKNKHSEFDDLDKFRVLGILEALLKYLGSTLDATIFDILEQSSIIFIILL